MVLSLNMKHDPAWSFPHIGEFILLHGLEDISRAAEWHQNQNRHLSNLQMK